jgi:hypothetical protein
MAESADKFFDEFFRDDRAVQGLNIDETARLVHGYLKANNVSAADVAHSTMSSLFTHENAARAASDLVECVIVRLAEERPETHDALVQLLCELKWLSLGDEEQSKRTVDCDVWMRTLLYEMQERSLRYGDPGPETGDLRDSYRDDWTNVNRFAALVHKAGLRDLSAWGEQTIGFVLKREGWRVNWEGPGKYLDNFLNKCSYSCAVISDATITVCGMLTFLPQETNPIVSKLLKAMLPPLHRDYSMWPASLR